MSIGEDLDTIAQVDDLKAMVRRLESQLARAKDRKADMIDAVYQAMHDSISAITIPRIPKPAADRRRKRQPEVAVPILSDWQLGKVSPTYDSETAAKRIVQFAGKVLELTEIQRADHPVRTCTVVALGDLLEGELVFPGQAHLIDSSIYRQVTGAAEMLTSFVRRMLTSFDSVHVVGVIGNHGSYGGRARRDMHPESNADRTIYRTAQLLLRDEPRVTWQIPEFESGDRGWYAAVSIGRFTALAIHGDQFRGGGYGGLPWYCFDDQTEVLTKRGWLTEDQMTSDDEAWTINPETSRGEWCQIEAVHRYEWHDDLISIEGQSVSALVTPNHRWLLTNQQRWEDGDKRLYERETKDLNTADHIPLRAYPTPIPETPTIPDALVALLGWAVTEGSFRSRSNEISVYQSHEANASFVEEIRGLLEVVDATFHETTTGDDSVTSFNIGGATAAFIRSHAADKVLTEAFLRLLTYNQKELLFRTMMKGDGCYLKPSGQPLFSTISYAQASAFQALAIQIGYGARLKRTNGTNADIYRVTVTSSYRAYVDKTDRSARRYDGTVWCVRTANGSIMVRRDDKAYFTGNSMYKKALGWKTGAIPVDFSEIWCGHWHQPTRLTLNRVTLRVSGSTESYNTYAQEALASVGSPSQPLLFVSPSKGRVTADYTVWL